MEVKALGKNIGVSPRKARLVCGLVRGLDVARAEEQLENAHKKAARFVKEILKSAIANAENNHQLVRDNLFIKKITTDSGRTLVRFQPRAMGRAFPVRHHLSHITIVLDERVEGKRMPKTKKEVKQVERAKVESAKEKIGSTMPKEDAEKKEPAKTGFWQRRKENRLAKKGGESGGFKKRFFQRKSQ